MAAYPAGSTKSLTLLSRLLLAARERSDEMADIRPEESRDLLALAETHHVLIRALQPFQIVMSAARESDAAVRAASAIETERSRIDNALAFLTRICKVLEAEGCDVVVIKSLDHWPDLGSDLDLFTSAQPADVVRVIGRHFKAALAGRSWGDRLANKWNFIVPGLRELVELHVGRLGQTGEQVTVASSLIKRARSMQFGTRTFRVPAAEDRLIITTLQRMYRHFYLRLCDVVDTTHLLENDVIDYAYLQSAARVAGIWQGLATFLVIVSDYVEHYRGHGLDLPSVVRSGAQFGGDQLSFREFLRIPILPHSLRFYASQLSRLALNGEVEGTFRLSLLPCLATAAVVGQKITGSDKGVW
jgi:Uncharacterised nucleotidyltransferase